MKAAVLTRIFDATTGEPGKIECLEWPKPEVSAPDDVLVRVAYAAICGSDKHYIKDNLFRDKPPCVVGHEWSGTIEDLGPEAEAAGLTRGQRVTGDFVLECGHCINCRTGKQQFCLHPTMRLGTQAEYAVFKAAQLYALPDDIDMDVAALVEPFAIACNAILKSGISLGKSVFIIGAGSIGQMLVQLAKTCGASVVATSARTAEKRELALGFGADYAIDPNAEDVVEAAMRITDGRGFDIVFEVSANAANVETALGIVGRGGKVMLVSYYDPEAVVSVRALRQLVMREVTVQGLQIGQQGWPYAIQMLPRVDLRPIISKVYDLADVEEAYADLMTGKPLKILLRC